MSLVKLFQTMRISSTIHRTVLTTSSVQNLSAKYLHGPPPIKPTIGRGKAYRRIVHYPEKYTVKPLDVTNLAGRDPISGRLIVKGIGGGIKHKYHWIKWIRDGPEEGPPQEERVIEVFEDGCRTAHVALVAAGNEIKYIIATENMKAGDIIKTSRHIPRIAVRAKEGDAYPLGALPDGTVVCCIEALPGQGSFYMQAAGCCATIVRKENNQVILKMPKKNEFSFDERCVAVVGRVSNVLHNKTPIGSAQRNRWLGNRPRSGLWQRKTGRHGRKIKPIKKMMKIVGKAPPKETIQLSLYI